MRPILQSSRFFPSPLPNDSNAYLLIASTGLYITSFWKLNNICPMYALLLWGVCAPHSFPSAVWLHCRREERGRADIYSRFFGPTSKKNFGWHLSWALLSRSLSHRPFSYKWNWRGYSSQKRRLPCTKRTQIDFLIGNNIYFVVLLFRTTSQRVRRWFSVAIQAAIKS